MAHKDKHGSEHQDGGADEIDVGGLSGELADDQPPKLHTLDGADHGIAGKTVGHILEATATDAFSFQAHPRWEKFYDASPSITTYQSIAVSRDYGFYLIRWAGLLDNGGNVVDNKWYLRVDNDSGAARYRGFRYGEGDTAYGEASANTAIEFARTVYYRDTYFDFTLHFYAGKSVSYFEMPFLRMTGITYETTPRLVLVRGGGVYLPSADPSSVELGIVTTGAGYTCYSRLTAWRKAG